MNPELLLLWIPAILFSIIVHEYAHGLVAKFCGDETAMRMGRLTLNPIPHIDLIGTIILPAILIASHSGALFGWAKPVPVNPANFRNRRYDSIWVSAAGPVTNILLALVAGFALRFYAPAEATHWTRLLAVELGLFFQLNIGLSFFNLLPIPPLDGSHILAGVLPPAAVGTYLKIAKYVFYGLMGAWAVDAVFHVGIFNMLLGPLFTPYMNFWQWVVFGREVVSL